ncbi:6-phosphogluconate dehydratase [Peptostreptococcus sp. MV1]|uniref:DegV family protein n=1 Tax=Peptostreptococcus sp. MV1 TaxID=1219626 RepID=UPI00050EA090|nr:DegV family protein [Peptostreptococcus sp. MV1]KGF12100.1 6-phosphogluconate dehydratase [Peptostreptococcus sp. MV1]
MNKIKIVCDSLSDMTQDYLDLYNIDMLPLSVIIDGVEYKDRVDIDGEKFYQLLRNEGVIPKTSQVTFGAFYENFKKHCEAGYDVLYISAAASATGTYQSALLAKAELEEIYDSKIRVVDSNTLCFTISILIIRACQLREEGKSIDEIVDHIESVKDMAYGCFLCDDLLYLSKGGRISGTKATIGTVLGIKPLCILKDGIVDNVGVARGKKNVAIKLVDIAKENGISSLEGRTVYIGYSDDLKERDRLEEVIKRELNPSEIRYFMIGCGIGTHGGPGTTGFICWKDGAKDLL